MAIIDLGKVVGKDGANATMEIATKEKAGAVRIGDDFNINSENGTISVDTAFNGGLTGYQEFAPSESPKTIFGKILASLKYLKENAGNAPSNAKKLEGQAPSKEDIGATFPETETNPGWYLINVQGVESDHPVESKNALLHVEKVSLPGGESIMIQTLYEIANLANGSKTYRRHKSNAKSGLDWSAWRHFNMG